MRRATEIDGEKEREAQHIAISCIACCIPCTHIYCNNNIAQNGVYTQAQFIISRKMFALVCNFEMIIGLILGIVELHRLNVQWYSHVYMSGWQRIGCQRFNDGKRVPYIFIYSQSSSNCSIKFIRSKRASKRGRERDRHSRICQR